MNSPENDSTPSSNLSDVKITRDDARWEVEIKAQIPAEVMARYVEEAVEAYQRSVKVDGFRPGKAPRDRVVEQVGETSILHHAAEQAVQAELPSLLARERVLIVEAPKVVIEPPQKDKALSFTARAPLAPEIVLPDYGKIAQEHRGKKTEVSVEEKEVSDTLTHLRRERARIEKVEAGTEPKEALESARSMEENDLPPIDDAFAQTLGYESSAVFTEAVRANIKTEKELRESEKRRIELLDELITASKISYPASLKEYELDDMEAQFSGDLSRAGMTMEGYLAESKKTREELRKTWEASADKRAKIRLVLAEIGRKEKIEADRDSVEHELEHARQHYPQAAPDALRSSIAHGMRNEKVIRFLETGENVPLPAHDHSHD